MKIMLNTNCKSIILTGIVLVLLYCSCKKVDEHTKFVNDQPAFAMSAPNGKVVVVGDTVTLIGRFFLDKPSLKLRIGGVTAPIFFKQHIPAGPSTGAQPYDVIKYVVTSAMGHGPNIPVQLTANNITISGPFITIQTFSSPSGKSDTTLWVDKVVTWLPANVNQYKNASLALVNSSCVDAAGNIYFTNSLGVFSIKSGKVQSLINAGDSFTENGVPFTIRYVMGSVTSIDGNTLNFSAWVNENNADTVNHYVFRLCKMHIGTNNVTTINRTLVKKGLGLTNEDPTPYEGRVNKVKMVAMDLKTDINQNLYFVNMFFPETSGANSDYTYLGNNSLSTGVASSNTYTLSNICQVDATGQVTSLFFQQGPLGANNYTPPGYRVDYTDDYLISLDGSLAVVATDFSNFTTVGLTLFDVNGDKPLASLTNSPAFRILSSTGSVSTYSILFKYDTGTGTILSAGILPNNNLLSVSSGGSNLGSLAAVNLQNQTGYLYAGTEAGLIAPPPEQNQTTGKAKNVLFDLDNTYFSGVDPRGSVYYNSNGGPGTSDYTNGVTFYKLYSKK